MTYSIKEMFYTLQSEGAHTGRPAVFLRFAGCNLWSGQEVDRASAVCRFCDTDFVGTDGINGGRFETAEALTGMIRALWPREFVNAVPFVVCTGGEPLLQFDESLIDALHSRMFQIAVETNGTIESPAGIDWLCVSPKAGSDWICKRGNELKLVVPQEGLDPQDLVDLPFEHFFLQPMDGPNLKQNTEWAVNYCKRHPQWRLSLQIHKFLGIP